MTKFDRRPRHYPTCGLIHRFRLSLAAAIMVSALMTATAAVPFGSSPVQGTDGPVRATLLALFKVLKDKDVNAFHRYLPSRQQQSVKRENLVLFVSQIAPFAVFQRGQIGEVQLSGDFAVADTILFVGVRNPDKKPGDRQPDVLDAKVVMQQYLVREGDIWKIATGDINARQEFVRAVPEFNRGFTIHPDRLYLLRNGKWVETQNVRITTKSK